MIKRIVIALTIVLWGFCVNAQQTVQANQIKAIDSLKVNTKWVKSIITDTSLAGATDRDVPSASAIQQFFLNRFAYAIKKGDTAGMLAGYSRLQRFLDTVAAHWSAIQGKQPLLGFTPVPNTRIINGHQLNADVVISATDITTGTLPNAQLTTSVTLMGNVFNGNNQLLQLDGAGKVSFANLPSSLMIIKGVWNPVTNSPALSDGTGTAGWTYKASFTGVDSVIVNFGSGNWTVYNGDYAIYNNSGKWEIAHTGDNGVVKINGKWGLVTITTTDISEGVNLYYTDGRARAAVSAGVGINYNSTTGVISTSAVLSVSASNGITASIVSNGLTLNLANVPNGALANSTISGVALGGALANLTPGSGLSGSAYNGSTPQTFSIAVGGVTNAMLAGSIDYAKMNAATVPTWNQSTTGNAATATDVTRYWNGVANDGFAVANTATPSELIGMYGGVMRRQSAGSVQVFLGLGSNAYTSISYLPILAGSANPLTNPLYAPGVMINGFDLSKKLYVGGDIRVDGNFALGGSDGAGRVIYLNGQSTHYNVMIAAQQNINNTFEITPSTTIGGSTYSTPAFKIDFGASNAVTLSGSLTASTLTALATPAYSSGTFYFAEYDAPGGGIIRYATVSQAQAALGISGGPFLPLTGGTLTGDLTISKNNPSLAIAATHVGGLTYLIQSQISGVSNSGFEIRDATAGVTRWYIDATGTVVSNGNMVGPYANFNGAGGGIYNEQLTIGVASTPKITWAQTGGYRWSQRIDATNGDFHLRYEDGGLDVINYNRLGNVGIGFTPTSWNAIYKTVQVGLGGVISSPGSGTSHEINLTSNLYYTDQWRILADAGYYPSLLQIHNGGFVLYSGGVNTVGGITTLTQVFGVNNNGVVTGASFIPTGGSSGNLLVGNGTLVTMAASSTPSTVVLRDASGNFSAGAITATSFIGALNYSLSLGSHLSGGTFNNTGNITISTDASSSVVSGAIVARDASGDFSARQVTLTAGLSAVSTINAGGLIVTGTILTGSPTLGTAKPWKFGSMVATTYTTTKMLEVEVDGVMYYIPAVSQSEL